MTTSTHDTPIIGIDLGTTNSVLAIVRAGAPQLLSIDGSELLPSVVGIDDQGATLVGHPARNQWVVAPERTVRSIKRKMGSSDTVTMGGQPFTPQEISAFILRKIADAARAAEDALYIAALEANAGITPPNNSPCLDADAAKRIGGIK